MDQEIVKLILAHGGVYVSAVTLALLVVGLKGPRIMLQDYPKAIRDAVPPKTKEESRQTYIYGMPFMLVMIGYPLATGLYYSLHHNWAFLQTLSFVWGIALLANVYDLLVLDWLIFCTITPKLMIVPGTEGNKGYKDYRFHFIGFLKGIVITLVISLLSCGIIELVRRANHLAG